MIDELTAFANANLTAEHCLCNALPNVKKLTPSDMLRLAAKLEHLAAILRMCANCQAETGLRQIDACPLFHQSRKN